MKKTSDIQQMVTDRITDILDQGVNPWQKCWEGVRENGMPFNLNSKRAYSGANVPLLLLKGGDCPAWVTYKGAQELGGNVRKGAKSTAIVFWNFIKKKDASGEEKTFPMLKTYRVFNALHDCEGLEEHLEAIRPDDILPSVPESALADYVEREGIKLQHGGNQAYFAPALDLVKMPHQQSFKSDAHYQSVLAHECVHSTGTKDRLNRKGLTENAAFGSETYAFEELVAEIGACITCAHLGIEPDWNNSAAYLKNWSDALKDNPSWMVSASGKGAKAASFILNLNPEQPES